jgi:membrane protein
MPTSVTAPWLPSDERARGRRDQRRRDERHPQSRDADRRRPESRDADQRREDGDKQGLGGVAQRAEGVFPVRVIKRYAAANGSTWAIDIAWNTLLAFFPIILLITTILTALFGSSEFGSAIDKNIQSAIPGDQGAQIVQALHSFHKAAGVLFIISFVGLAWSGTSLFSALDQGLNALYPTKQRGFVRQKLMGIVMIAVFAVLVALDVGSASLLSLVTSLPNMPSFVHSGVVSTLIQIAFGIVDGVLLFGAIFLIVPNRPHRVREILPGALTAAVLFEAFTLLFPLYFKLQHGFTTYGTTFALFFLLMTFAFWVAQIIMFGASVNAERHPPEPGAFPRAGSMNANAQQEADAQARRG